MAEFTAAQPKKKKIFLSHSAVYLPAFQSKFERVLSAVKKLRVGIERVLFHYGTLGIFFFSVLGVYLCYT